MKPTQLILLAAVVVMAVARTASAQSPRPVRPLERPLPNGIDIDARDGDRIIVEGDARVRVITRHRGLVRAVYSTEQRWLILMIDSSSPDTGAPDGKPDLALTYNGLEGDWPLGERWEGYATVDQYTLPGPFRPAGVGIATPEGLVQIFPYSPMPDPTASMTIMFRDASARAALTHRGSGTSNVGHATFDQLEQTSIAQAKRNLQMQGQMQQQQQNLRSNTSSWAASGGQAYGAQGSPAGPLRKIVDVPAKYPEAARQSRVMGVVILEITVQPDGTVSNARVLRSIPSLDAAALEAVRQWRYEPTGLQNAVNMTVTVNFAPQR